jgi:hypothetical protein
LLSKNLQPPSLSIADAKVHTFSFRATLFEKNFQLFFYGLIINALELKIFPKRRQKVSKPVPSRAFLTPFLQNFYAKWMRKGGKVINF